jgi:glycine reductase complex component B subunit alpha and beta
MRLELADFPVTEIHLGDEFRYNSGALVVDMKELLRIVREDPRISDATIGVARPGEKVRITGIRDLVEPRFKVRGSGQIFPGTLGPVVPVGDGRTHRLSGMAVMATAEYEGIIRAGTGVQRSAFLDMWGPGAEMSRFGSLAHLVLVLRFPSGLPELAAHSAIQGAEYKVARRLAQITERLDPQRLDIFDVTAEDPTLPRVTLIQCCLTESHQAHSGVSYYGLPIRESLATVAHPNELLDGALTPDTTRCGRAYYPTTWDWQNHPLLFGLYGVHGKEINLVGVILERIRFETYHGKEVIAHNTAQLAKAMGSDGALITWLGGGNAFVDVMLTVQACERDGIKAVLVTYELGGKDGVDAPLLHYVPEVAAVVSTGSRDRWAELPAAEKVFGPYEEIRILSYPGAPRVSARGPLSIDARDAIIGGVDIWGAQSWTCKAC